VHFALVPMGDVGDLSEMRQNFRGNVTLFRYHPTGKHRGWRTRVVRRVLAAIGDPKAYCWNIDDWYDESISTELQKLYEARQFDVVIVVYVFLSKAFDALPNHVVRLLDTNDRFADRHLHYLERRQIPRWFSTTRDEECRGLMRADVVIAIQDSERQLFTDAIGDSDRVVTVGHIVTIRRPLCRGKAPAAVFVGSDNPINVHGVEYFAREVLPRVRTVVPAFELWLVGDVCRSVGDVKGIVKHGRIEDLSEIYSRAAVAVNPVQMGTGLNIKTIECLGFGMPLVTTEAGSRGLEGLRGKAFVSVPDNDPVEMARAIDLFMRNAQYAESYGLKALDAASAWNREQRTRLLDLLEIRNTGATRWLRGKLKT
jgi:polysaccharide biosynthesis protein PslH